MATYIEFFVVGWGLILMVIEAFMGKADKRIIAYLGIGGLSIILAALAFTTFPASGESAIGAFYTIDPLAKFYKILALIVTIVVLVMAIDYAPVLEKFVSKDTKQGGLGEYFCLPVFVCAGLMWMASANDFIMIFVALETVTIAFYILVAFMRRNVGSLEAGVKYLILGALSTGFLVYGITWVFGLTGETNLDLVGQKLAGLQEHRVPILFAFSLVAVGLAFKVAAVPFQFWVPDVYQGAPTPTTAFLSVGSKAAGFIVATRVLEPFLALDQLGATIGSVLLIVAGATIVYGNLAALPQSNFKRLLAYSSISHAGFLVLALCCKPEKFPISPANVVAFYLATYALMTLLCFMILVLLRRSEESDEMSAFNGLAKRSPFLAFSLLIGVISLAGVPLTVGFLGKFFVFFLAVESGHWITLGIAVLGAAAGFYYYLKVARSMFWNAPHGGAAIPVAPLTKAVIIALVVAIVLFGVYPAPILALLP